MVLSTPRAACMARGDNLGAAFFLNLLFFFTASDWMGNHFLSYVGYLNHCPPPWLIVCSCHFTCNNRFPPPRFSLYEGNACCACTAVGLWNFAWRGQWAVRLSTIYVRSTLWGTLAQCPNASRQAFWLARCRTYHSYNNILHTLAMGSRLVVFSPTSCALLLTAVTCTSEY